jgi:hypothetical protein
MGRDLEGWLCPSHRISEVGCPSGRQATKERDVSESQRLMSIAGYCERLADFEDWQRDCLPASEPGTHQRAS